MKTQCDKTIQWMKPQAQGQNSLIFTFSLLTEMKNY